MDRQTASQNAPQNAAPRAASSPADAVAHAFENDLMTTGVEPSAGPFVINLCAGMTPLSAAELSLPGLEKHRIFQLSRIEDGRRRYRVRVGVFAAEAEAEAVLCKLRDRYPAALITSATDEDLRCIKDLTTRKTPTAARAAASAGGAVSASPASTAKAPLTPKGPVTETKHAGSRPAALPASASTSPPAPRSAPTAAATQLAGAATAAPIGKSLAPAPSTGVEGRPPSTLMPTAAPARAPMPASASASAPASAPGPVQTSGVPAAKSEAPIAAAAASFKKAMAELSLVEPSATPAATPAVTASVAGEVFSPHKNVAVESSLSLAAERDTAPAAPVLTTAATATARIPRMDTRGEIPFLDLTLESNLGAAQPMNSRPAEAPAPGSLPLTGRKLTADEIWKIPDLDSTQTIRTLTAAELSDENQPKAFVVQLAASDHPVNLEAMPRLDIFSAYRLYSVAIMEQGKILHALRLGFFKEEVSAQAVSGYVKTFFNAPQIVRVSAAEQQRFETSPAASAPPSAKVVELSTRERPAASLPPANGAAARSGSAIFGANGAMTSGSMPAHGAANTGPARTAAAEKAGAKSPPSAKPAALPSKSATANLRAASAARSHALEDRLRAAARDVEASQSGIRRLQTSTGAFLSRLVGKLGK